MKKLLILSCFLVVSLVLTNCILFKKEIPKPVTIKLVVPNNYSTIAINANYVKYANAFSEADYQNKFLENLISEGKLTKNVTIDNETQSPDFIIEVKSLSITESDFTETINDAKSPNNGKQFLLNKVECNATVHCIDGKTNKLIGLSCSNSKIKQEKLKNNRNLGDLISGTNKDHSTYRQKTLADNIAQQLAGDVGRRIWVPITKRIKKSLK